MSHVRIVCKAPPAPAPNPKYPNLRIRMNASWVDCEAFLVSDDGSEIPIDGITSLSWSCEAGQVATAVLRIHGVAIDVETAALLTPSTPLAPPIPPVLRSYCPACEGYLQGGRHFEGRVCGTCHGVTEGRA